MFFWGMKSMMTIHNLKFQGVLGCADADGSERLAGRICLHADKLEFQRRWQICSKADLVYADYITTVSDTYAQEIQTPYYGEGLDGLLSAQAF